ncbi:MAG: hypothetical protein IPO12_13810 [Flavobacteriales bacterium]|nr:hypothetical protein [Flavobacteriales bacterium]
MPNSLTWACKPWRKEEDNEEREAHGFLNAVESGVVYAEGGEVRFLNPEQFVVSIRVSVHGHSAEPSPQT